MTPETARNQMMHLLTGNLRGLPALLLRRRIAHDAELAREWTEMQTVAGRLRQVPMPVPRRSAPDWPAPDVSASALKKRDRKRGLVIFTAVAISASGSVASYRLLRSTSFEFRDERGHEWVMNGDFQGRLCLYDTFGKGIYYHDFFDKKERANSLATLSSSVTIPVRGMGKHKVYDKSGRHVGYAELLPWSYFKADVPAEEHKWVREIIHLYDPDTLIPTDPYHTGEGGGNLPGLAARVVRSRGIAWKVIGHAKVSVQFPQSVPRFGGWSKTLPLIAHLNQHDKPLLMTELSRVAPKPGSEPRLFWSLATPTVEQRSSPYLILNRRWASQWRSGQMRGYGRHVVKDDRGQVIVTFDVQPLKPVAAPAARR